VTVIRPSTLVLLLSAAAAAQSFEVAAVKRNASGPTAPNGFNTTPGRFRVLNSPLEQMIHAAFHIPEGLLAGLTGWMRSDRYDIEAKTPAGSTFDENLTMLRALLIERFQLRFHSETRESTLLALVLAKNGPKFHQSKDDAAGSKERIDIRPAEISGIHIPFGHFVTALAAQLKRTVSNETGLSGNFDLSLQYVRDDAPEGANGPTVFAALEDQLGLKLESRKGPVDVMVIDSAERPRGN
jgi:uncharacterized protein (TIGR03435 family)